MLKFKKKKKEEIPCDDALFCLCMIVIYILYE